MDNTYTRNSKTALFKTKINTEHFLDRAEECSEITIPSLIQPDGFTDSSDLYNPFQSVGLGVSTI